MLWILDKMVILPTIWGLIVVPWRQKMAKIRFLVVVAMLLVAVPRDGNCAPRWKGIRESNQGYLALR